MTTVTNKDGIVFDIDSIATDLANKADKDLKNVNANTMIYVVERGGDSSNWYTLWSDGWLEQGGYISSVIPNNYRSATVSLLKSYRNTDYTLMLTMYNNGNELGNDTATNGQSVFSKAVNSFIVCTYSWTYGRMWYSCGWAL